LIGSAIVARLREQGIAVREFDKATHAAQDVRDTTALHAALDGVTGIVHLAAVSRVVWAERDPELTEAVNLAPLRQIAGRLRGMAARNENAPWLIFASSREVYGDCAQLPVREDARCSPRNVYARSKVSGETLVASLAQEGFVANICRFSNVYGSIADHPDRVVPAFARAAALGGGLRMDGPECLFDFTHVDDVARGLHAMIDLTAAGSRFDPVHFVTGNPCSLRELADYARAAARSPITLSIAAPRTFDVARFYGDPSRASELLGWRLTINIEQGMQRLIAEFAEAGCEAHDQARLA
jgi:nucleoside-diphosphate-sugar epimerase